MKIAILADIHSNRQALEAVLADAAAQKAEAYVVAGDLISDGPSPRDVLERVRELTPHVIKGNREDYMLRYHRGDFKDWEGRGQVASLIWTYRQLEAEDLNYIFGLPEQLSLPLDGGAALRVVHGSPASVYELLKPDSDMEAVERAADAVTEPALAFAHNHMQWTGEVRGKRLLNPGSVGVPFNGAGKAEYAMLSFQNGEFKVELRQPPYDIAELEKELQTSGLMADAPVWTKLTFEGVKAGRNYCIEFIREARKVMEQENMTEDMIPNDLWDAVAQRWWREMGWGALE